jgi:hypothetical protein
VIRPQDYAEGRDPQLERGIKELAKLVKKAKPVSLHSPGSLASGRRS